MAQDFALGFYQSKAWRQLRDAFYKSKFGICERCGDAGLIVHHKTWLTPTNISKPEVALNWDLLELLCQDCHNKEHGGNYTANGLIFDEFGDLVQIGS